METQGDNVMLQEQANKLIEGRGRILFYGDLVGFKANNSEKSPRLSWCDLVRWLQDYVNRPKITVECVNVFRNNSLTLGKHYIIQEIPGKVLCIVTNDSGVEVICRTSRFKRISC
jgi:hypothetical protein